ncbi:hypothetical protein NDU88_001748 [Pleurodeles waltl]|uniref:Uncharacterized protein n=1 Tax=Pleurodeles waltl TaxID=8319 RepID=A0AAV7NC09_PLEWA|nr:hypothetical protein NDU88_001748 [Pleurodeles waltl]
MARRRLIQTLPDANRSVPIPAHEGLGAGSKVPPVRNRVSEHVKENNQELAHFSESGQEGLQKTPVPSALTILWSWFQLQTYDRRGTPELGKAINLEPFRDTGKQ